MTENLLLITIDSLRADHVGSYGYDQSITPTIDHLANEGTRFTNAVATSSHTKDSFPGIFSSALPSIQGNHHVDRSYEPLAVTLSNVDYETVGYHSTPMMASYDYGVGFDKFEDLAETPSKNESSWNFVELIPSTLLDPIHRLVKQYLPSTDVDAVSSRAPAEEVTEAAIESLDSLQEPFFLFTHYMDVHTPYWPPQKYIDQYAGGISENQIRKLNDKLLANKDSLHGDPESISEQELKQVRGLYDASIRYVDDCIDQLLESMSDQGFLNNTLVIVTADHGEEFRDHGGFFHGQKLYEELLRIPLVYYGPRIPQETVDEQVSHLGLMPTILNHLGHTVPTTAMGTNYTSLFEDGSTDKEFAFGDATIKRLGQDVGRVIACRHKSGLKLIYNEITPEWGVDQWELYDLDEDPDELANIHDQNDSRLVEKMRDQILQLKDGSISQDDEDEEIMERLKHLGYAE